MKRTLIVVGIGLCAASVIGCAPPESRVRTIEVHGNGVEWVEPDGFTVDLEVSAIDKDVQQARRAASERSARVLEVIDDFPLKKQNSRMTRFSVYPAYDWDDDEREFLGFSVSQDVHLHLGDVEQAEKLTIALLKAGIEDISTDFVSSRARELWPQARAKALQDAHRRAVQMAAELGQRIGEPLEIVASDENQDSGQSVFGCAQYTFGSGATEQPSLFEDNLHWMAPSQIRVSARVRVKFALLEKE